MYHRVKHSPILGTLAKYFRENKMNEITASVFIEHTWNVEKITRKEENASWAMINAIKVLKRGDTVFSCGDSRNVYPGLAWHLSFTLETN